MPDTATRDSNMLKNAANFAMGLIAAKPEKPCDRGVFGALNLLSKKKRNQQRPCRRGSNKSRFAIGLRPHPKRAPRIQKQTPALQRGNSHAHPKTSMKALFLQAPPGNNNMPINTRRNQSQNDHCEAGS